MVDGYEVNDYRQPAPKNKPSSRGDTGRPIYKYGWVCNGIDHSREAVCQQYSEKLDGLNEEFISVLTYRTEFFLFLPKYLFGEVILVDTSRRIKGPALEFGGSLKFIGV